MTRFHEDERHPGVYAALTPDRPAVIVADDDTVVTWA